MSTSKQRGRGPLPKALADRAEAKAAEAVARAREEALEALAVIDGRRQFITEAFYDMGQALQRLRQPRLYAALGYRTFGALVQKRLGISLSMAGRLIGIAEQLSRPVALSLGQERCVALVRLARATSGEDSAESLAREGVVIPGRPGRFAAKELSVRELLAAARYRHQLRVAATMPRWTEARTKVERASKQLRMTLLGAGAESAGTLVTVDTRKRQLTVHVRVSLEDASVLASVIGRKR